MSEIERVNKIMAAKCTLAGDRDFLYNLQWFVREKISRLQGMIEKSRTHSRKSKSIRKLLKKYRSISGAISQAICAVMSLLESPDKRESKRFESIFTFFVGRIHLLQKYSCIFACKFMGIKEMWRDMVLNANELKNLVAV